MEKMAARGWTGDNGRVVTKAGNDDIATECINTHPLKTWILIKSNFVMFVVAYTPTEEAAERQKTKYMSSLSSILATVSAPKCVFGLTDVNARRGKICEGGGEVCSKLLGA